MCTPYINLSYLRENGIEDIGKIEEIQRMLNKGLKHRKVFKINARTPCKNLSNLREKGLEDLGRIEKFHRMLNKGLRHRKIFKINANKKYS